MNERAVRPSRLYYQDMFATLLLAVTLAAVLLDLVLHRGHVAPATEGALTVDLSRRS